MVVMKAVKKEPSFNSTHNPNPKLGKPSSSSYASISPSITRTRDDKATFLHRQEVIRRRLSRLRQLSSVYKRHYWSLIEELRTKHRDYCWEYGKNPFEKASEEGDEGQESGLEERKKCAFGGCKAKAMALTDYCHPHILFDRKQTLYKPCSFVIKSTAQESILCRKPILRASDPSLCHMHYQKSQKGILQALKKIGFNNNTPSSSKAVPKLSVLICESIHEIQKKRRNLVNSSQNENEPNKKSA